MVASSGARLLRDEAVETYRTELLPLATVTTPNLLEATELTGIEIASSGDAREAAKAISVLGVKYVVVKGGHMEVAGESRDLLYDGRDFVEFGLPWIDTTSTHGTGCTFASAITAQLALGGDIESAFRSAKKFVWEAMNAAYPVGQGHGPLNQMWRMPPEED
jgi:hydroxymethylpyrimidine/phosphomethylpyrimidine kinase